MRLDITRTPEGYLAVIPPALDVGEVRIGPEPDKRLFLDLVRFAVLTWIDIGTLIDAEQRGVIPPLLEPHPAAKLAHDDIVRHVEQLARKALGGKPLPEVTIDPHDPSQVHIGAFPTAAIYMGERDLIDVADLVIAPVSGNVSEVELYGEERDLAGLQAASEAAQERDEES